MSRPATCKGTEQAHAWPRPGCLHTRPLALVPEPEGALLGTVPKDSPDFQRIAGEAARTIPGCGSPSEINGICLPACAGHGRHRPWGPAVTAQPQDREGLKHMHVFESVT